LGPDEEVGEEAAGAGRTPFLHGKQRMQTRLGEAAEAADAVHQPGDEGDDGQPVAQGGEAHHVLAMAEVADAPHPVLAEGEGGQGDLVRRLAAVRAVPEEGEAGAVRVR